MKEIFKALANLFVTNPIVGVVVVITVAVVIYCAVSFYDNTIKYPDGNPPKNR